VAVRTFERSVLVDHDFFAFDYLCCFVALIASDIGMSASQRQAGLVMIEYGRLPAGSVVAVDAVGGVVFCQELIIVSIFVTGLAFLRGAFETSFRRRRCLVAVPAGNGTVRP